MFDVIFLTNASHRHMVSRPLGAYKCAGALRKAGFDCLVVDHISDFTDDELESLISKSVSARTLFVGISTTFLDDRANNSTADPSANIMNRVQHLHRIIQSVSPNCKIVLGGTNTHPNEVGRGVGYSVIGYAESSIVNLANHLKYGHILNDSYRNIHGVTIIENKRNIGYDFANSSFRWGDTEATNLKVLPLEIARGCIFKCKFCSYPMNGKQNLDFIRSADNIYEEMQSNYDRFGTTAYTLVDDTFNDNETKLDMMLTVTNRLSFRPTFWAYTRLDLIAQKPELLDKLYDIGLRAFFFGIETLNRRTGLIIGKGYDRSKQIKMIEHIRKKYTDVTTHGSFIIGLPEESVSSVENTFKSLMDETIPLHSFLMLGLGISDKDRIAYPSEIDKNYTEYGYIRQTPHHIKPAVVNWKNEYMDYDTALNMSTNFMAEATAGNRMYINTQLAFALKNLGYDDSIRFVKSKDVPWDEIANRKDVYVQEYKRRLFSELNI